jgi:hypothetical protein
MTAERDPLATIDARIAAHKRAVKRTLVEYALQGLPADAVREATDELQRDLGALRRHRAQVRQWQVANLSDSERMWKLWAVADLAHTRLATMIPRNGRGCSPCSTSGHRPGRQDVRGCGDTGKLSDGAAATAASGAAACPASPASGSRAPCSTVDAAATVPARAAGDFRNTGRDDRSRRERDQKAQAMPTTGRLRGWPPIEPKNGASKAKTPPSAATSQ